MQSTSSNISHLQRHYAVSSNRTPNSYKRCNSKNTSSVHPVSKVFDHQVAQQRLLVPWGVKFCKSFHFNNSLCCGTSLCCSSSRHRPILHSLPDSCQSSSTSHAIPPPGLAPSANGSHSLHVSVPGLAHDVVFPATGSGLLWARTTGLRVWEGAQTLAAALLTQGELIEDYIRRGLSVKWTWEDKVVIELGCGLGLLSVVAAQLGAQAIATDGDTDLVSLARRNLPVNCPNVRHKPRAAVLLWGNIDSEQRLNLAQPADMLLLSDVIYGSNPGVWEQLVATLLRLGGPHTVILQAESYRREGVLYSEYWQLLKDRGFNVQEVAPEHLAHNPGGKCRLWVIHMPAT